VDARLTHFYHVWADGNWEEPVEEHIVALKHSGLLTVLDNIRVGYVGTDENIDKAENFLRSEIPHRTITRSLTGWEQETMRHIKPYTAAHPDVHVFYAHTKGAFSPVDINVQWRRSMTYHTVIRWEDAVAALDTHDASGCHWVQDAGGPWFFGGTYWWANGTYLAGLEDISFNSRWSAEHWIGTGNPLIYDLNPGHPAGEATFTTTW
jgi:hypothetical protein